MSVDGTANRDHIGTIVFDLDGVVYVGDQGVPGAAEALEAVRTMGWHVVFATNNSSRTASQVLEQIEHRTGYTAPHADVVTSGMAAGTWTARRHRSVFVVGEEGLRSTLVDAGLTVVDRGADAVVVGLDRSIDYATIADAARMVRDGATYVATNTDATFPTPSGPVPGAGAIVAAITTAAGCAPVACGKPNEPMIALIRERIRGDRVWVVGDRPETDIAMASTAGWTGALVLTGITAREDAIVPEHRPDHVVPSIADIPQLIEMVTSEGADHER